jgi:hypothetical protein
MLSCHHVIMLDGVCQPRTRNMSSRIPDCCLMLPAAPWHPFTYLKSSTPHRFNRHVSLTHHHDHSGSREQLSLGPDALPTPHRIDRTGGDQGCITHARPVGSKVVILGEHADFDSITVLFNQLCGLHVLSPNSHEWKYGKPSTRTRNYQPRRGHRQARRQQTVQRRGPCRWTVSRPSQIPTAQRCLLLASEWRCEVGVVV